MEEIRKVISSQEEVEVFFNSIYTIYAVVLQRHNGIMKGAFYYTVGKAVAKRYFKSEQATAITMLNLTSVESVYATVLTAELKSRNREILVFKYLPIDLFDAIGLKNEKVFLFDIAEGKACECEVDFSWEKYTFNVRLTNGRRFMLPREAYGKEYLFLDPKSDREK